MTTPIYRVKHSVLANPPSELLTGACVKLPKERLDRIEERNPRGAGYALDDDLLRELFEHARSLGLDNTKKQEFALDRWLAPRIHACIRVPRRIAADRNFWAWITMEFGSEYVFSRWGSSTGLVKPYRATGEALRNGISRLWWAAELLRNASSYATVDLCLRRAVVAQAALELKYSWYRPAAIAFTNVAENSDPRLTEDVLKALSVRANAYLPLTPLEAFCQYEGDGELDEDWWGSGCAAAELFSPEGPQGPADGAVELSTIGEAEAWFRELMAEGNGSAPTAGKATRHR